MRNWRMGINRWIRGKRDVGPGKIERQGWE